MTQLPPLPWLRAFEVSARHLSFTSAAQELNLSQAAVSKQIKLLEQQLREPLFLRFPRSLSLTKAGEAFLPKVQDAFERLAAGTNEVFGQHRTDVLTVRVAVGFGVQWLASRLPDFLAKHPDIPLRITSSVWNEEGGDYDLDIRYGDGNWQGIKSERLTREWLTPVCSPTLAATMTNPKDVSGHPLIHVLGYKEGWARWLKQAGVKLPSQSPALQFDNSLMAFALAKQGAGIALARTSMLGNELTKGTLVAPFKLSVPVEEGFHLFSRDDAGNAKQAGVFRDWIIGQAANES